MYQEDQALSFGGWLKERRKELDLTQFELGERVGCSEDTIQKIESGERRPSKQTAQRLAECLLIPPEEHESFILSAREAYPASSSPGRFSYAPRRNESPAQFHPSLTKLPTPITPLIGREEAVAEARGYLLRDAVRLLTLTGAPGIGKTRLSLQVAAELRTEFTGGVFFTELASISDPDLVIATIAGTLGLREIATQSILDGLKQFLGGKSDSGGRTLIVLDNFEQVLDAAPVVVELLSNCPQLKVLVTSREALHVMGEQQFPVPPLQIPDISIPADVQVLPNYPAVELFMQRASATDPSFRLTGENSGTIAAICVRLEGLPLAIELAAARIKLLSPEEMFSRLDRQLVLLTGATRYGHGHSREGIHHQPVRHQTMRGAVDWSYNLLDVGEQKLLSKLGVFVGGWTLEAAEAVCAPNTGLSTDVAAGIESLLEKSLLRISGGGNGSGRGYRFAMLEAVREYALERLKESGEDVSVKRRCAEFYLHLVEQAEPELASPRQVEWLQRLEEEHSNLRSILVWSLEREEVEIALRLTGALWRFWLMRGHLSEGRKWLQSALDGAGDAYPALRAKGLRGVGSLAWTQGDIERAWEQLTVSIRLYQEIGDRLGEAHALMSLGIVHIMRGQYAEAEGIYQEGLDICQEIGDDYGIMRATHNLGVVARYRGDYPRAQALFEVALAFNRKQGDKHNVGNALDHLGHAMLHTGDHRGAAIVLKEGMLLFGELGDKRLLAQCLLGLAGVAGLEGRPDVAVRLFAVAETLREAIGVEMDHADQVEYDRYVSVTRSQVSPEIFGRAWQEGQGMSIDEAIVTAYAIAIPSKDTESAPTTRDWR